MEKDNKTQLQQAIMNVFWRSERYLRRQNWRIRQFDYNLMMCRSNQEDEANEVNGQSKKEDL